MKRRKFQICTFLVIILTLPAINAEVTQSLVVYSTDPHILRKRDTQDGAVMKTLDIYQMHIKSMARNRFVQTTVVSKVKNLSNKAQEAAFAVILPDAAFISSFVMEINGRNYTAVVKEKEEAQRIYNKAIARGTSAAQVAISVRNSNFFNISVNIEPLSKVTFYLNYEELLQRQLGYYEVVINLYTPQPIRDLSAEVVLSESSRIINLNIPSMRSGNEIKTKLDSHAQWGVVNQTMAIILFNPDIQRQKQLSNLLEMKDEGFTAQFVVQYDVQRDPSGGEVLVQDGYFAHFFAPSNLVPLPKHVIFVLDTSNSMAGMKIDQLKQAMNEILDQMSAKDVFHIVEFNSEVKVWNLAAPTGTFWPLSDPDGGYNIPNAFQANHENIANAKSHTANLRPQGATNIYDALYLSLILAKVSGFNGTYQPLIMFLTDGEPTEGIQSSDKIVDYITNKDNKEKVPIFSLSLGDGADKNFLLRLSLNNAGFSKHIYEAGDAALQLSNFYKEISSPLLTNVTFKYESSDFNATDTNFPIYFQGSELVVAGQCDKNFKPLTVQGWNGNDYVEFRPTTKKVASIERLWAYLTIKQLLAKRAAAFEESEKENLKQKALDLSLKYSFVTPVSSLVVVKPQGYNKTKKGYLNIGSEGPTQSDFEASLTCYLRYNKLLVITVLLGTFLRPY